jgi:ribonuclease P protein component
MDFARELKHAPDVRFSSDAAPKAESASQQVLRQSKSVLSRTGRFQQADRILCARDFSCAVGTGKRRTSKSFVVIITPKTEGVSTNSDEKRTRLGITVSKRVGNAVIRNRVKRCIREWFRQAREGLPRGSDIVVIARQTARDLSGREVAAVLDEMVCRVETRGGNRAAAQFR